MKRLIERFRYPVRRVSFAPDGRARREHPPAWFAWHGAWYGGLLVFSALLGAWYMFGTTAVFAVLWAWTLVRRSR